jgi:lysophospholipase L1-like esterase
MRVGYWPLLLLTGAACAQDAAAPAPAPAARACERCDWGALARYRAENARLEPDAARVVFLGDSITEAWAREPLLAGNPHYVGRGIGGQTAPQMLVRFRADVVELKPRIVHLMAGTNDVAENFGAETDDDVIGALESMAELARIHGIAVLLASIPPAADFPWHPGLRPVARLRRLNARLRAYAASTGIGFVDYWPVLATAEGALRPEYSTDGVHPNADGYRAMEPLARAAIRRALERRPAVALRP